MGGGRCMGVLLGMDGWVLYIAKGIHMDECCMLSCSWVYIII